MYNVHYQRRGGSQRQLYGLNNTCIMQHTPIRRWHTELKVTVMLWEATNGVCCIAKLRSVQNMGTWYPRPRRICLKPGLRPIGHGYHIQYQGQGGFEANRPWVPCPGVGPNAKAGLSGTSAVFQWITYSNVFPWVTIVLPFVSNSTEVCF